GVERVAGDLQLQVILVRPLPGALARRRGAAGDCAGGLLGLLKRVGHALHAEHAAVDRHRPVGHVADGEDVRVGSAGLQVDDDAAATSSPASAASSSLGVAPTPTTTAS